MNNVKLGNGVCILYQVLSQHFQDKKQTQEGEKMFGVRVAVWRQSCNLDSELQFGVRVAGWNQSCILESELPFGINVTIWSQSCSLE